MSTPNLAFQQAWVALVSEASTRALQYHLTRPAFSPREQQAGQKQTLDSAYQVPEQGRSDRPRRRLHKQLYLSDENVPVPKKYRGSVNSSPLPSLHPIPPVACFRAILSCTEYPTHSASKRALSLAEFPLYFVHPMYISTHVAHRLARPKPYPAFSSTARPGPIRSFYSGSCSLP